MKKFEFSMQKILDIQEAKEQAAEQKLAVVLRELAAEQQKLNRYMSDLAVGISEMETLHGNRIDRHAFGIQARHVERLQTQIETQCKVINGVEVKVDDARLALHKIMRGRKSLEKLKDVEFKEWWQVVEKLEQKDMDEFAASIHRRSHVTE